ncbi:MAG: DUF4190 domain-containing protein [Wenzhouxiangellaceae bacterium]|nr:DUF4190 domain-containing protein [Wenzhouxiangellaceae bacterium]
MLLMIVFVLLIVFLCAAISMMVSSNRAGKLTRQKINGEDERQRQRRSSQQASAAREFDESWEVMTRYDADVQSQLQRLEPFGQPAIEELKRVYQHTGDKDRMDMFTDQIIADIGTGKLDLAAQADGVQHAGTDSSAWLERGSTSPETPASAIVSLVSGVLALLLPPAALVAIVSGHVAVYQSGPDQAHRRGRVMARLGLALGYLVACSILLLWMVMNNWIPIGSKYL